MYAFRKYLALPDAKVLIGVTLVITNCAVGKTDDATTTKPGDTIVVTADAAELRVLTEVVAKAPKGERLIVEKVRDNWLWTHVIVDGERRGGWLHSRFATRIVEVRSLDADAFWAWAEKKDTAQAYRCFVFRHPEDSRAPRGKERWAELDFSALQKTEPRSAYWRFLLLHPDSRFADEVREKYLSTSESVAVDKRHAVRDSSLQERALQELLAASRGPNFRARARAINTLCEFGDRRTADVLLMALEEPRFAVAIDRIARELGRFGDPHTVEVLAGLLGSPRSLSRDYAATALAAIGNKEALDALASAIGGSDPKIQAAAAKGLGKIGGERARQLLIGVVEDCESDARSDSVRALGEMGDPQAANVLLGVLRDSDADSFLRMSAAHALGRIGDPFAVEPMLRTFMQTKDDRIGSASAAALSEIGDPTAIPTLIAGVDVVGNFSRQSALRALGRIGDRRAVPALINALRRPFYKVRREAASALGSIADDRAVDALLAALGDSELVVRSDAASALGSIGHRRAVEPLKSLLKDPDRGLRGPISRSDTTKLIGVALARVYIFNILDSLHKLAEPDDFLSVLRESVHHSDLRVRYLSVRMLKKLGTTIDVERLIRTLQSDPSQYARAEAAQALGAMGDRRAVDSLVVALKDNDLVRKAATSALARITLNHDTRMLLAAMNSTDERVRRGVAAALSEVAEKRSDLLLSHSRDQDTQSSADNIPMSVTNRDGEVLAQVRAAGSRVATGDSAAMETLREGLKSRSIEARIAAVDCLSGVREHQPGVIEDLKSALAQETSVTVKLRVVGELAKARDIEAIEDIRQYLRSDDPVDRSYAAEVLGEADGQGVADELVAALDDEDPLVRVYAATAIIRILNNRRDEVSDSGN